MMVLSLASLLIIFSSVFFLGGISRNLKPEKSSVELRSETFGGWKKQVGWSSATRIHKNHGIVIDFTHVYPCFMITKALSIRDHVEWPHPLLGGVVAPGEAEKGAGIPWPGVACRRRWRRRKLVKKQLQIDEFNLVGGLVAIFYFPIYWE